MKSFALLLVLAATLVGAGCGGSGKSSPNLDVGGTTVSGYGMTIALPPGWSGRVYRLSPQYAITLQAATVPLPTPGDDQVTIAARMKPTDAYLVIDDIGPPPPGLGREPVWQLDPELPLTVSDDVFEGPWKGGFPSGTALAVVINDRSLMIRIFFGSHPREREIEEINALLATLSVVPRPT
jgi:hypothetical protein